MALLTGPIESKVQAASLWTLGASVGIAVLNAVAANSTLLGGLPALAQFAILAAIPPTATFLAGYVAPSTPRPDLYTYGMPAEPWLPMPPEPAQPAPPAAPLPPSYYDAPYSDQPYSSAHYEPAGEPTRNFDNRGRHRA
jgi:hypothetical protein